MLSNKQMKRLIDVVDRPDFSHTQYWVMSEIARGGMGTVYLAKDTQLERQIAIKVLNAVGQSAEIIARLEHPGIIPVHDVGTLPDGRIFYVMKYVRGKRLDHHVDGSGTLGERLRLFRTACEAVAFAHAHEVVHRDLKPEDIMVGPFGEVLIIDWGIAKLPGDHAAGQSCWHHCRHCDPDAWSHTARQPESRRFVAREVWPGGWSLKKWSILMASQKP